MNKVKEEPIDIYIASVVLRGDVVVQVVKVPCNLFGAAVRFPARMNRLDYNSMIRAELLPYTNTSEDVPAVAALTAEVAKEVLIRKLDSMLQDIEDRKRYLLTARAKATNYGDIVQVNEYSSFDERLAESGEYD